MDDDEVATQGQTVHGGRGTVRVQVDEGPDVAKDDDGGGDVCVQVDDGWPRKLDQLKAQRKRREC